MPLIDVVNFNADASCLSASKWLRCLEGGSRSRLAGVLRSYAAARRKVNLGFTGATAMDIAHFNPEAIALVNEHPQIFEIVLRPFAHDNGLLRLPAGFRLNLAHGLATLRKLFRNINTFFLAPENMVTGEQIRILRDAGLTAVFLHKGRYDASVTLHIPDAPYRIHGVFGTEILAVPFAAQELELRFLRAVHGTETPDRWAAAALKESASRLCPIWRDGESCLLHPVAPEHEAAMLSAENAAGVERAFLSELDVAAAESSDGILRYFPMHSMRPWLDSMKLFWYVGRVQSIEEKLESMPERLRRCWLLTINSDILSAAEKKPPIVPVSDDVLAAPAGDPLWEGVIALNDRREVILTRSERAGEGEDYLAYLELMIEGKKTPDEVCARWRDAAEPHLRKAFARVCD